MSTETESGRDKAHQATCPSCDRKAIGGGDRDGVGPAAADGRISMRTTRRSVLGLREPGQIVYMGQRIEASKLWRSESSLPCAGCGKAGLLTFGLCRNGRRGDGYPKRSCLQKAMRLNEGFLFMGWVRKRALSVPEIIRVREHYLDEIKRLERQLAESRAAG